MSVLVTGLSPSASEEQLRQFLSYCGDISRISIQDDPEKGRQATVQFVNRESVDTAVLVSGAVVVDRPVTIVALEDVNRTSTQEAMAFIETIVSKGVVTGDAFITSIKKKAQEFDKEHGVLGTVAGGAAAVGGAVKSTASGIHRHVSGRETKGNPTNESWMYGNQPQWGPPPQQ